MAKLKILFEASPMLYAKRTGVGFYVERLIDSLQREHSRELKLYGYYFNFLHRNDKPLTVNNKVHFKEIWLIPGKILSICRRLHIQPPLELFTRQSKDVVLFTNYVSLPQLIKHKTGLIVYDLGFLDVPEFTHETNLAYLKRFCPPSIRNADVLITISEFTKERLTHYYPHLKASIVVTPIPPAESVSNVTQLNDRLVGLQIREQKYLLYLGTIEPRKNLQALVKAYALLSEVDRKEYSLVLAGGKGWKDDTIFEEINFQKRRGVNIILTGYLSEDEKSALYRNALMFIMPSHYEGFGMPILEAMQHDIPIACSNIPVFHEVAGKSAVYFDKDDITNIAESLKMLIDDPVLRSRLVRSGRNRLKEYSWNDNAKKVFAALS